MKKTLPILLLAASLATTAQAQSARFGLKAGVSLTNFTGRGVGNNDYKVGFNGGVFGNFAVSDALAIQPELLYSMKGAKYSITGNKQNLHYIDVPVLAHIDANGLFFELGPQVGFLVAADGPVILGSTTTGYSIGIDDNKTRFNTLDFGYAAGLGYQVTDGPGIGLRYNGGFSNISKDNTSSNYALRNGAFQLYLTYLFGSK